MYFYEEDYYLYDEDYENLEEDYYLYDEDYEMFNEAAISVRLNFTDLDIKEILTTVYNKDEIAKKQGLSVVKKLSNSDKKLIEERIKKLARKRIGQITGIVGVIGALTGALGGYISGKDIDDFENFKRKSDEDFERNKRKSEEEFERFKRKSEEEFGFKESFYLNESDEKNNHSISGAIGGGIGAGAIGGGIGALYSGIIFKYLLNCLKFENIKGRDFGIIYAGGLFGIIVIIPYKDKNGELIFRLFHGGKKYLI